MQGHRVQHRWKRFPELGGRIRLRNRDISELYSILLNMACLWNIYQLSPALYSSAPPGLTLHMPL
jgi:hypothetical protein